MSVYPKFRDVHLYVGLVLLAPLLAISGTGILLNHEHALGLKPTYERPPRTLAEEATGDARAFVADSGAWQAHGPAIEAALQAAQSQWGPVALDRIELKDEPAFGMVVKVKAAKESGAAPEEIVWSVADQAIVNKTGGAVGGWNWHKIVMDLHTGKLFSRHFGFWWSDLAALAILLLGGTGVVLYVIPLMKKAARRRAVPGVSPRPNRAASGPASGATIQSASLTAREPQEVAVS